LLIYKATLIIIKKLKIEMELNQRQTLAYFNVPLQYFLSWSRLESFTVFCFWIWTLVTSVLILKSYRLRWLSHF